VLIINGFFENGVFIPEKPLNDIRGRQKAILRIEYDDEKQGQISAWKEFSQAIRASDEVLKGEPERIHFKTPEDISIL
jgi:hypothetical protein